ncbi:HdeA/HdeB family chaperone [Tabrizicola sp. BL-A-41-H6]|uniref:HdeA/HdeB family chaperone n=1 Tax=Tabrizicola sp. BL-A-41-H6 TaxID=3421107 RepID=UPI003D6780DC
MKTLMKTVAAVALLSGAALPAVAGVDVPSMTCGSFTALDGAARKAAAADLLEWLHAENSTQAPEELIAKYAIEGSNIQWDGDTMKVEIEGHCSDASADVLVLDRLKEHS